MSAPAASSAAPAAAAAAPAAAESAPARTGGDRGGDRGGERRGPGGGGGGAGGRPGWMSVPGGPKEPNFQDFLHKLQALNADKAKLYDKLDVLRGKAGVKSDDPVRAQFQAEQQAIRAKIQGLRDNQRGQRDAVRAKRDEMMRLRAERRKYEDELRELSGEVGLFRDASEVEAAMDRLLFKMETGGAGGLKEEKVLSKRLGQLERIKGLLEHVAPLTEAIDEAEELERSLEEETRGIRQSLDSINDELGSVMEKQLAQRDKRGTLDEQRQKQQAEREEIISKIRALATKIETLRHDFDEGKKAWNEWREVAKVRYAKEQEEKFKERDRRRAEIEAARKAERKTRRAAKKLNPYEAEIATCDALAKLLKDKAEAQEADRLKAERARKLAEFDPTLAAPKGTTIKKDDATDEAWLFGDRAGAKKKGGKPQAKKATPAPAAPAAAPAASSSSSTTNLADRPIHIPAEKLKAFEKVQVPAPATYGKAQAAIDALAKKKKHFESFKKSLDEISTDGLSEEEDEAAAAGTGTEENGDKQEKTVEAAAVAVAAVVAVEA